MRASLFPRLALVLITPAALADDDSSIRVIAEFSAGGRDFQFERVPLPAINDAAAEAEFTLIGGSADPNGAPISILHNGRVPREPDEPSANFFLAAGTDGGRVLIDLHEVMAVQEVRSYSWHPGSRGPQVYTLYASDGAEDRFAADPGTETDPSEAGWKRLARVDTRVEGTDGGGQHGVAVRREDFEPLGSFRYLLLEIERAGPPPFGNTFYSEIDVIGADGEDLVFVEPPESKIYAFQGPEGRYRYTVDATQAPDLTDWVHEKMMPMVKEWYPKLVAMLPSEGFTARDDVVLEFRSGINVPAYAGGNRVTLNVEWFRRELEREALGCVVHELVHIVQDYGHGRRNNPNATRNPGWIVEGIPDYIRWFLYEPEVRGAEITARNIGNARYDASYRISANFLNWVVNERYPELIPELNAAAREGRYSEDLWVEWTGKSVSELGDAWMEHHRARLESQ